MRAIKTVIAVTGVLLTAVVCGYMLYLFHTIAYLPPWLNYMIRVLCVVAVIAAIVLCSVYLRGLRAEARRKKNAGKTTKVSTK